MITANQFINRLSAQTQLKVKGAAELDAAQADHKEDTAYIILLSESAERDTTAGDMDGGRMTRQLATVRIGVVLAIRNRRDRRGAGAMTELEAARESVRSALLGWQPGGIGGATIFVSGEVAAFADRTIWWQDVYEARHLITSSAAAAA